MDIILLLFYFQKKNIEMTFNFQKKNFPYLSFNDSTSQIILRFQFINENRIFIVQYSSMGHRVAHRFEMFNVQKV